MHSIEFHAVIISWIALLLALHSPTSIYECGLWEGRVVGEKVGFYQVAYEKVWLCVGAVGV